VNSAAFDPPFPKSLPLRIGVGSFHGHRPKVVFTGAKATQSPSTFGLESAHRSVKLAVHGQRLGHALRRQARQVEPRYDTVLKVLRALGMQLHAVPVWEEAG